MFPRRLCLAVLLIPAALLAQDAVQSIQVAGAVKQSLTLTAEDLAKMPRPSVKIISNGMETVYEGVWLYELLKCAGSPQGEALRGKALAGCVLADTANGIALFGAQGRFRLLAPKMLTKLEVVQLRK